ncbi:hypothetical protein [Variovorax sp. CY25R-8]|nr:hypothetical protein [Variovorax sp. CY25R-8]MCT8174265.1 hypothetical protein [Variovorax sp. CY25R-8]
MTTALHSEKTLLQSRLAAHAHVLAVHKAPVALTLAAVILSVLGVRA